MNTPTTNNNNTVLIKTQTQIEALKMELAKVGLCMVHGMSQHQQAEKKKHIDTYVKRIQRDSNTESLERAVSNLFASKNASSDPIRMAAIAMHMCDRLLVEKQGNNNNNTSPPSRLIRDASRYTEHVQLKEFLKVVADEVDRVDTIRITKQVEASVDMLVDLYDDEEEEDDHMMMQQQRRRILDMIHAVLPGIEIPDSIVST